MMMMRLSKSRAGRCLLSGSPRGALVNQPSMSTRNAHTHTNAKSKANRLRWLHDPAKEKYREETRMRVGAQHLNAFGQPLPGALGMDPHTGRVREGNNPSGDWERTWRQGITPWETKESSRLLEYMIANNLLPKSEQAQQKPNVLGNAVNQGRALVPGCGSGLDAFTLATAGYQVTGIELAKTAITKATRRMRSNRQLRKLTKKQLNIQHGDFFTFRPENSYELVFDHLFIPSLPPSLRPQWAKTIRSMVAPEGRLIIQLFPCQDYKGGPPFAMSEQLIRDLLEPMDMECELFEDVPHHLSHPARKGREKLSIWKHNLSRYPMIKPRTFVE